MLFTAGGLEFAYRASVTSPLASFGHFRLGLSSFLDLWNNGSHSYGKSVQVWGSIFFSGLQLHFHAFFFRTPDDEDTTEFIGQHYCNTNNTLYN